MDLLCDAINYTSPPPRDQNDILQSPRAVSAIPQARSPPHSSDSANRCHLCGRVYERPDHLNRHLKSHENARPHKCTRCPKSFNRADLLTRHQAGHDRNAGVRIEKSDRVSTACLACIASKTKCQDQKPCARCRRRNISCEMGPNKIGKSSRKASSVRAADISLDLIDPALDKNEIQGVGSSPLTPLSVQPSQNTEESFSDSMTGRPDQSIETAQQVLSMAATPKLRSSTGLLFDTSVQNFSNPNVGSDLIMGDGLDFIVPDTFFSQDLDFEMWDIDLDSIDPSSADTVNDPAPQNFLQPQESRHYNKPRDVARRYAAFEKSPWLWTPTSKDQTLSDQSDIQLDEESISVLTPSSPATGLDDFASCCMTSKIRDQMLALLFNLPSLAKKILSFPSLSFLNNIVQIYFVQESYRIDSLIHPASTLPSRTIPQLYLAIVAQGSTLISTPAVWKMGLAIQEVVRHTVVELWENNNSNTRNLQALQAFVISLDIGLWSGFKRKMEIAESFGQPVTIMLRRAGAFAPTRSSSGLSPQRTDSEAILESKWRKWAERESYKRLVLHLFIHDVHASIALQKPPLINFSELKFDFPASRELWLAKSATSWRDLYLSSQTSSNLPSFLEAMHNPETLFQYSLQIDVQLTILTLLHGFWGQIYSLHESKKFYPPSKATHRLCLLTAHTEIYRDLKTFSTALCSPTHRTVLIYHLFMMILHVSPEDLQRFAGKFGEDEARKASVEFQTWAGAAEARVGVWHAGQVLKAAASLMPAQLRGFNAIAVYYAALALWVYGLMASPAVKPGLFGVGVERLDGREVALNEGEIAQVRDFRSSGDGVPGLRAIKGGIEEFIPLTASNRVLGVARDIYNSNFPVRDEGLPPLVENLGNLLRDLSELPGSRVSRAPSEGLM